MFSCRVDDLFVETAPPEYTPVQVVSDTVEPSTRLTLGKVRDRVVGFPLKGTESVPFGLRAADGLARGPAHVAGTHLHNSGKAESNVEAARQRMNTPVRVFGFSLMEEGLMVGRGNPLGIRTVADLAQPMVRFVNREPGAALRVLLDDQLRTAGIDSEAINGYRNEVFSHREGAYRIACTKSWTACPATTARSPAN